MTMEYSYTMSLLYTRDRAAWDRKVLWGGILKEFYNHPSSTPRANEEDQAVQEARLRTPLA